MILRPAHLLYDKAADSDALRERLEDRGVELVTPHRKNRTRLKLQDGRACGATSVAAGSSTWSHD